MVEQTVPNIHKTALPNRSERLQLGKMLGTFFLVHTTQTNANGAGRDNDNAVAILAQLVGSLDNE